MSESILKVCIAGGDHLNEWNQVLTRYQWLNVLTGLSPVIARLNIQRSVSDEVYWDGKRQRYEYLDAFNLSNCVDHNKAIARCFDALDKKGVKHAVLTKYLVDLTSRNTYGTFCELSAYLWLVDGQIPFDIQIPVAKSGVLNPNGSKLDGRLKLSTGVLFDVKGFGFQERLVNRLRDRLSNDFPTMFVAVEGSWDVPISDIADHLLSEHYEPLRGELAQKRFAQRGRLAFILREQAAVRVTHRSSDPYSLAEQSSSHAFIHAKQFARRKPFLLIFVIHPWFSGMSLHVNFADYVGTFTRALARRTFMQFCGDRTSLLATTKGTASTLLSGMAFLNAWQGTPEPGVSCRLFLNPHAKHPISALAIAQLRSSFPNSLAVDGFYHDTY